MEWIRRNKLLLWLVVTASVLAIASIWAFEKASWGEEIRASQLGLATLPWIALWASGFALIYEQWFGGPSPGPLFVFRRVMFWIFISLALAIFLGLYGVFIFRLW